MIYILMSKQDDPMGCPCCKMQPEEYIIGLYSNEHSAKVAMSVQAEIEADQDIDRSVIEVDGTLRVVNDCETVVEFYIIERELEN